jgi:Ni,Fe-hydrogenase III small subunit
MPASYREVSAIRRSGRRGLLTTSRVMLGRLLGRALYTETVGGWPKRSVFVRHLDGGSSNVVELELAALTNPVYDLAQYGIRFVASPRHADVLLLTGPLTRNMLEPARQAFAVMPEPKSIVTVGDFAALGSNARIGGRADDLVGLFSGSYATVDLPEEMRRAIVASVPGDPPHPHRIIQALLAVAADRAP